MPKRSLSVTSQAKHIIVVGGGILGAAAAWHLSKAGAAVTLIEHAPGCSTTATASSFGWVGASASTPSNNQQAFAQRLQALQEFVSMERELGALPITARGALLWLSTEEETAAMIAEHKAAGTRIEQLARAQIAAKLPMLAKPPTLAAWAPLDLALQPAALARQLLAGAQAAGARVYQAKVDAITVAGNRISGVLVAGQTLKADTVVLAAGYGSRALALTVGVDLPIHRSPAVLLRFGFATEDLHHLICAQGMELRPSIGGGLVAAADYPDQGESGLPTLAKRTADTIADCFGMDSAPPVLSVKAAQRPMTDDGRPLCGYVGKTEGLWALTAHPGVILAPLLGRLCAESVLST